MSNETEKSQSSSGSRLGDSSNSRNFVFTYNNPEFASGEEFIAFIRDKVGSSPGLRYIVFQKELGKEGTFHYQGFIQLERQVKLRSLRNKLKNCMFIDGARNPEKAIEYCQKAETRVDGPWFYGAFTNSKGKRTELNKVADMIIGGAKLREVALAYSPEFIKYHKGIESLIKLTDNRKRHWMTTMYIYWGVAGSGKSHDAHKKAGEDCFYLPVPSKVTDKLWFNGYIGQKSIIIEDFNGTIDLTFMLKFIDKYPMQVEVKGSMVEMLVENVYITSNKPWQEWYPQQFANTPEWEAAFKRRITEEVHYVNKYDGPLEVRLDDPASPIPELPPLQRQNACLDFSTYIGEPVEVISSDDDHEQREAVVNAQHDREVIELD